MALTYDLTQCANSDALTAPDEWDLTRTLIHATMLVGIGHLRHASDARQFTARLRAYETSFGSFTMQNGKDRLITLADVTKRIGLKTNVFPRWSDARLGKLLSTRLLREAALDVAKEVADASADRV